jgi:hypothetical protein
MAPDVRRTGRELSPTLRTEREAKLLATAEWASGKRRVPPHRFSAIVVVHRRQSPFTLHARGTARPLNDTHQPRRFLASAGCVC